MFPLGSALAQLLPALSKHGVVRTSFGRGAGEIPEGIPSFHEGLMSRGKCDAPFFLISHQIQSCSLASKKILTSLSLHSFCLCSLLESPCDGGPCDGQLSAHHPQPAVLCPDQNHSRGCGCQRDQASCTHTHTRLNSTCVKCLVSRSRRLRRYF